LIRFQPTRRAIFIQEANMTETIETKANTGTANSEFDVSAEALAKAEAQRAAFNRLDAELQPRNKAALFDALEAAGIATVAVSFDGYGDSGQIENIEVQGTTTCLPETQIEIVRAVWGKTEPERSIISLADALERVVYDCLEQTHCGWEDNEGAYGEFTFDVLNRKITLDYNERYTGSHNSQHEF
jgi:hypothetical protein